MSDRAAADSRRGVGSHPLYFESIFVERELRSRRKSRARPGDSTRRPGRFFLQETTPAWERWAKLHLKRSHPYQEFRHHGAAGGLALLSKTPFDDVAFVESPVGWFPGWAVLVQTQLGPVQVLNVHLHPPVTNDGNFVLGFFSTGDEREEELSAFLDELDPKWPTLVVGDFNGASGAALRHAESRGLICALHEVNPGANTWYWPLGPIMLRNALDHILHDNMLGVVDAWTLDLGESDHIPIVSIFSSTSN
ncbi:MAG: endonuclease/exonuclease/phosphatase family protein [Deltaproteobacteria bacterium]|nr:endonuclease/exonuclease/phosphatase family protein [Deltaproteobacteria bacterium]